MPLTRRQTLAGLLGAAALGGTASCASGKYLTPEGVISLWYWDRSISDTLLAKVPQATGIKIRPQKVPLDYKSKLIVSLAGKAYVPDIAAFNDNIAVYFTDEDQFHDLYEFGAKDVQDQYLDWKWQQGVSPTGRLIGFPMDTGPTGLYYRKDVFDRADLPSEPDDVAAATETWADFLDLGEQLVKKSDGSYLVSNPEHIFTPYVDSSDRKFMTEDHEFIGDGEHVREAWELANEAHRRGLTARTLADTPDEKAALQNGKVAGRVEAVWWAQILRDTAPGAAGKWRVAAPPGDPGNNGGSFLGITKSSRDPELAWEVIKWVQSPKNQLFAYNEIALFPAAEAAVGSGSVREPEKFFGGQVINDVFGESAKRVKKVYLSPYDDIIGDILTDELTNVWATGKNPDRAWQDAQNEIERQLEQRGLM